MAVMVAHEGPKIVPEPPLHPFFSTPRALIESDSPTSSNAASGPQAPHPNPLNSNQAHSHPAKVEFSAGRSDAAHNVIQVASSEPALELNETGLVPPNGSLGDPWKQISPRQLNCTALETDPDAHRNKRRKSDSAFQESQLNELGPKTLKWDDSERSIKHPAYLASQPQLQLAADLGSPPPQIPQILPTSSTSVTSLPQSLAGNNGMSAIPQGILSTTMQSSPELSQATVDSTTLPSTQDIGDESEVSTNPSYQNQSPQPFETSGHHIIECTPPPPRKMLRLNSRGKFSSPISKQSSSSAISSQSSRGKGRSRKARKPNLLVILKYGSDGVSRAATGEKINNILDGSLKTLPPPQTMPQTSQSLPKESKQTRPTKPTHPFFLQRGRQETRAEGIPAQAAEHETLGNSTQRPQSAQPEASRPKLDNSLLRTSVKLPAYANHNVGARIPTAAKHKGLSEAAWPWKGIMHVRGIAEEGEASRTVKECTGLSEQKGKKSKQPLVHITKHEDLLFDVVRDLEINPEKEAPQASRNCCGIIPGTLRLPQRKIITGHDIQNAVIQQIETRFPQPQMAPTESSDEEDELQRRESPSSPPHPALSYLYQNIPTYFAPFDTATCDTHSWAQKYAPTSAEQVLQAGKEAFVLRDWLMGLTVQSTETTAKMPPETISAKSKGTSDIILKRRQSKKKRKRDDDMQDFIVSSGDEADQMDELSSPEDGTLTPRTVRSIIRTSEKNHGCRAPGQPVRVSNAVVISGPNGCGKTAAVYAVAKELDFEVFEINSGSRRNGKDIIDKVGDMTRNHLVNRSRESLKEATGANSVASIENVGKSQGSMASFLGRKGQDSTTVKGSESKIKEPPEKLKDVFQVQRQQKQSLILLEEVDVLFEEDKQFWLTVLSLISQSRRPVIMTCNDESMLPLESLSLHAILRFEPPPEYLALDFLLLLAAREGHLLRRDAVQTLYRARSFDLRASISEIDFWCQMAVGDRKGGLEWIPDLASRRSKSVDLAALSRVVSVDTYLSGMGWIGRDHVCDKSKGSADIKQELMREAWDGWQVDLQEWRDVAGFERNRSNCISTEDINPSPTENLAALRNLEEYAEYLSADDAYTGFGFGTGHEASVDPSLPSLTDRSRSNYTEGSKLVQTDPVPDFAGLLPQIRFYVAATTEEVFRSRKLGRCHKLYCSTPVDEPNMIHLICHLGDIKNRQKLIHRSDLSSAFDPISEPPTANVSSAQPYSLQACSFDRTFRLIVEEIAPFVRGIVSFDMRLEEQRLRLSNLLSQGGRDKKKPRTTRASRSALEGGTRSATRRDRWFTDELNPTLVLKTGSLIWREVSTHDGQNTDISNKYEKSDMEVSSRRGSQSTITEGSP